ncbi:hypothetical protein [Salinimonas sediminis]|nr:hypothetical protein [Salinimonas sediminis]
MWQRNGFISLSGSDADSADASVGVGVYNDNELRALNILVGVGA